MGSHHSNDLDRRKVLKAIGVAAGTVASLAAVEGTAEPAAHATARPEIAPTRPDVRTDANGLRVNDEGEVEFGDVPTAYFGELTPGTWIDRWQLSEVRGVRLGTIAVVMHTRAGERFQVDLVRREDAAVAAAPVDRTQFLAVYLVNEGDGSTATVEEQGLGAMALARVLREREARGATPPTLLTLTERNARFPRAAFRVGI